MKNIRVIGVSGVARSGKDTFTAALKRRLEDAGYKVARVALADPLKELSNEFLLANLGISAFTQVPEEKALIRPMLVWFGDVKRKQTNGQFWTNLATKRINELEAQGYDFAIVSDVRYAHYEIDELHWLKNTMGGILIHVSRYTEFRPIKTYKVAKPTIQKKYIPPANDHEMINDPKVKAAAHYCVEWPTYESSENGIENHPEIVREVNAIVEAASLI